MGHDFVLFVEEVAEGEGDIDFLTSGKGEIAEEGEAQFGVTGYACAVGVGVGGPATTLSVGIDGKVHPRIEPCGAEAEGVDGGVGNLLVVGCGGFAGAVGGVLVGVGALQAECVAGGEGVA